MWADAEQNVTPFVLCILLEFWTIGKYLFALHFNPSKVGLWISLVFIVKFYVNPAAK